MVIRELLPSVHPHRAIITLPRPTRRLHPRRTATIDRVAPRIMPAVTDIIHTRPLRPDRIHIPRTPILHPTAIRTLIHIQICILTLTRTAAAAAVIIPPPQLMGVRRINPDIHRLPPPICHR